jgi:hypothetical protein
VNRLLGVSIALLSSTAGPAWAAVDAPEVPFELVHNEVLVFAKVNGKGPFLMKIDSGADPSLIDIHTAMKLGLTLNPAGEGTEGGNDEGSIFDTRFTSVELGGVSARDVDALAGGMVTKIGKRLERPIVGVLGRGFFSGRIAQFDYSTRKIRFLADLPAGAPEPGRRAVMTFKDDENVLVEDVSVNGRRLRAAIDLGSGGTLTLFSEAAGRLGLPKEAPASASLSVGTMAAESVPLTVESPREKKSWDANLGNGFLKGYIVTIDYPDLKVVLEKP